ncbi:MULTISPECIES: Y-family DNA polymerase [Pseudomonas]|uniref:Y-family DNA polymerase n=1 Tax=Pseudomonas hygromyciniae TaxID=2812000 RepID=A0ABX7K7J4_9PSED|nr:MULTISPECIES: Y-family DNA polymerase [Pseudomonas]HCE0607730.1 Y-family DNA polymerase [Pseudomonas aeruginosa]MBN0979958.1 Y-family DNA polymerase [Pseudomonas hygromyciniae]MCE1020946.1 Y-family DNA polymerase [Pseudomonas monteilii]MDH0640135.1 Y-family DNA polymerase [Pseudomonas sp. GD03860]MDM9557264.1 Y-family DNA polymerase [Pseudomonas asiatica]
MCADSSRPIFALVDVNAFYCSCERIFRPELRQRPVVVLSNSDGCIVARTNEAKALGLKMGDPYFKVRGFLEQNGVAVFSSNYTLYGELSHRVGVAIASLVPEWERYSIDELFCRLDGLPEPIIDVGRAIQARVLQWTALPVGVGIGHTKTLAKAAQHASKVWREKTGGVVDLRKQEAVEWLLRRMPVDEVWGIGRRMRDNLASDGISTAWELSQADARAMGRKYSVVLERTIRELAGESCMDLEQTAPAKQSICSSKMFGKRVHTLRELQEALATYIHRAAEKLRMQRSLCGALRIGIQTSFHGDGPKYANAATCIPAFPTDDVRQLTKYALQAAAEIYRPGFAYSKAEVLLMDLRKRGEYTQDLFSPSQPERSDALMATMDKINRRWGHDCLRTAAVPLTPDWGMRRALLSPSYMTSWDQLWTVQCR